MRGICVRRCRSCWNVIKDEGIGERARERGEPDPRVHWSFPTFRMKIPFLPQDRIGISKGPVRMLDQ